MAVSPEQSITLPCGLPSVKSCSSINWTMEGQMKVWLSEVVTDGRLMSSEGGRYRLLQSCSLKIAHVQQEDARQYTCNSGTLSSSVSLRILERKWDYLVFPTCLGLNCNSKVFIFIIIHQFLRPQLLQRARWSFSVSWTHLKDMPPATTAQACTLGGLPRKTRHWKANGLDSRTSLLASRNLSSA